MCVGDKSPYMAILCLCRHEIHRLDVARSAPGLFLLLKLHLAGLMVST